MHWGLLALFLGGLVLLLGADGLASHLTGAAGTPVPIEGAAQLHSSRAIFGGGDLAPEGAPAGKRIALTFDDGPDPKWTPADRRRARAARRPGDLLRRRRPASSATPGSSRTSTGDGFEIGNHTFTHADLTGASGAGEPSSRSR